ncbi:MAG: hypothetical protein SGJ27_10895 [Candidatus Melainabacteria bacterium]|nr:hypothetical protein [Candidatus Melainabacteria bacterium]
MQAFDRRLVLQQVQPFMAKLLADECAIKNYPKHRVEEAITAFYTLIGAGPPEFVWLTNPWQMHFAPGFFSGYKQKPIRVFDSQIHFAEEFRTWAKKQLGDQNFNSVHNAIQEAIPVRELLFLSQMIAAEDNVIRNESEAFSRNPWYGKILAKRLKEFVPRPNSKVRVEQGILEKIESNISWYALEHYTGNRSPWASDEMVRHGGLLDYDTLEELGIHHDWGVPRRPRPDLEPMVAPRGVEWSHYLRMHLAFAMFCREHLNMEFDADLERVFKILNEFTKTTGSFACFLDICFVCEPPIAMLRDENNRFHSTNGPAIAYQDQYEIYFWHNTRVPSKAIVCEVNLEVIEKERNVEVLRVLLERYGIERYIQDAGAVCFHEDKTGVLYRIEKGQDAYAFVAVTNSTPEIDGTYKRYFLQVPPTVATAREAVAWTFNLNESEYNPAVET